MTMTTTMYDDYDTATTTTKIKWITLGCLQRQSAGPFGPADNPLRQRLTDYDYYDDYDDTTTTTKIKWITLGCLQRQSAGPKGPLTIL